MQRGVRKITNLYTENICNNEKNYTYFLILSPGWYSIWLTASSTNALSLHNKRAIREPDQNNKSNYTCRISANKPQKVTSNRNTLQATW